MSQKITLLNLKLVFLKAACHANSSAERNFAASSPNINTYFESSQIHQLT